MSRIFEALKHVHLVRGSKERPAQPESDASKIPDRRRSPRRPLDISVYVYGYGPGAEPFHEEALTLNVSAGGALLLLSVPVHPGQILLLTNQFTQRDQDCRVVHLGAQYSRTVETGVAFPRTNPEFWHIRFPPEDKPSA